jgi:surface polysaccharide O-acyltransferase-like enzyme
VYTLFAIYLITPFLIKIVKASNLKQLFVLFLIIIFPGTIRPLWNIYTGFYVFLFSPLLESYLGYFLLGYILSKIRITLKIKIFSVISIFSGFILGTLGNISSSSYSVLSFPYNGGYSLNHYLIASGLFLLVKEYTENRRIPVCISKIISYLSEISFGIYWVHVIVLDFVVKYLSLPLTPILFYFLHFIAVTVFSVIISSIIYYIKPLRKMLI